MELTCYPISETARSYEYRANSRELEIAASFCEEHKIPNPFKEPEGQFLYPQDCYLPHPTLKRIKDHATYWAGRRGR